MVMGLDLHFQIGNNKVEKLMSDILEQKLHALTQKKDAWRALSNLDKISHIEQCMHNLMKIKDRWIELCVKFKHIDPNSQTVAQEWFSGPIVVMRMLRLLKRSLLADGSPDVVTIYNNKLNQFHAKVLPTNFYEKILFHPIQAEIIIQKDKLPTQGEYYRSIKNTSGSLCVVLGAGNVSSMPALDVIHQLFIQGNVCLLKFNPVNEYLFEIFDSVFKSLIENQFLVLAKGGKNVGEYLCAHSLTDAIHLTGSIQTYQSILQFNKKITAELGCVTPVIATPGRWDKRDLLFYAKQIASAVENNASFNCNAMKVLLLDADWPQKNEFLTILRDEFAQLSLRYAYYPGACERYLEFAQLYPHAEIFFGADGRKQIAEYNFNECSASHLPWMIIPDVDVKANEYALRHEAFCGVLAIVEVSDTNADPIKFLNQAVDICNHKIFGTLSCTLIVDSKTQEKYHHECESAITNLHYGSVGVNCWAAVSYALCATTWGAFTNTEKDSGIGVINNAYFIDYPEKSIVRAPFRQLLKPVWFYDKKNASQIAQKLFKFEYSQNFLDFLKLSYSAFELF